MAVPTNNLKKAGIENAEQLQAKIDEYFEKHQPKLLEDKKGKPIFNFGQPVYEYDPPTLAGLALFLGYSTPDSFKNPKGIFKKNYWIIIEAAKTRLGDELNRGGLTKKLESKLVARNLACNHDMVERKEVKNEVEIKKVSKQTEDILDNFDDED